MAKDHKLPKPSRSRKIAVMSGTQPKRVKRRKDGEHSARDKGGDAGSLIAKLRKPMAPPTRVAEDERKYSRARMRERSRKLGET